MTSGTLQETEPLSRTADDAPIRQPDSVVGNEPPLLPIGFNSDPLYFVVINSFEGIEAIFPPMDKATAGAFALELKNEFPNDPEELDHWGAIRHGVYARIEARLVCVMTQVAERRPIECACIEFPEFPPSGLQLR